MIEQCLDWIAVGFLVALFGTPIVMAPIAMWFGRHERPDLTCERYVVVSDSERYPCDGSLGMNHPCI